MSKWKLSEAITEEDLVGMGFTKLWDNHIAYQIGGVFNCIVVRFDEDNYRNVEFTIDSKIDDCKEILETLTKFIEEKIIYEVE